MRSKKTSHDLTAVDDILGHLNFATGGCDPKFLAKVNSVFRGLAESDGKGDPTPLAGLESPLAKLLLKRLSILERQGGPFADAQQARDVIELVHGHVLPAYRQFHRDLLFRQADDEMFGPLFLGRVYEAALAHRAAHAEPTRDPAAAAAEIVSRLNDYVGHRPLAVLETRQTEPYAHEWHRPVPLYVRGAGVAAGKYAELLSATLKLLESTPPQLLAEAHLDPQRLDELAMDARAYDFDHPVNKRPNYQFGHWDPHQIDNRGFYRRFVVRRVVLDALVRRTTCHDKHSRESLLFESAAVLAGTMLMSAELSGAGPGTHGSDVTLGKLVSRIALHRDRFYKYLLDQETADSARLREEARRLRQPFGGVRQYLNRNLARRRAAQLQHVHLAQLYARLGQTAAAKREIKGVATARARIVCQIQCLAGATRLALDGGQLEPAARAMAKMVALVHRGVQCGALVDPWNILGCDANFSLFPALENTAHDHRTDELIEIVGDILATGSRTWVLAAAANATAVQERMERELTRFAAWWDQFASTTVSAVESVSAAPICDAARSAAAALATWQQKGATAGDIGFWRPHVEKFDSPRAFQLVIDALLDHGDYVASMALVIHWLSQADRVTLREGSASLTAAASRWLAQLLGGPEENEGAGGATSRKAVAPATGKGPPAAERWRLMCRFFDSFEANADEYWHAPRFELNDGAGAGRTAASDELQEESPAESDDDDSADLFAAAYDGMVYHDSGDDGVDTNLLGPGGGTSGSPTDHEFELHSREIAERLGFLVAVAHYWSNAALWVATNKKSAADADVRLASWHAEITRLRCELAELLDAVRRHRLSSPGTSAIALAEYEHRRSIRDSLLERIAVASIAYEEASLLVLSASDAGSAARETLPAATWQPAVAAVLRPLLVGNVAAVRKSWPEMHKTLAGQALSYVPLGKGGSAEKVVAARSLQRAISLLLGLLPRLGLLPETLQLLRTAGRLERSQTMTAGMVTEFDQLVKVANQGLAECVVASQRGARDSKSSTSLPKKKGRPAHVESLTNNLEILVQAVLTEWLAQSRTTRLSVLEKVFGEPEWQELVHFIRTYGGNFFDQNFLQLVNIRAILHRGVDVWLADVQQAEGAEGEPKLIEALRDGTAPPRTKELLQLVLEAVAENNAEYRDYNSTTTQSDRGEQLYAFLDFLRLRVRYDRIDWNVMPVAQVHEVLVRQEEHSTADAWFRELAERTRQIADELDLRLKKLTRAYAMQLPTVTDRLRERFLRSLKLDEARAQVRGAYEEFRVGKDSTYSARLRQMIAGLSNKPSGAGLDVPAWLEALQDEVDAVLAPPACPAPSEAARQRVPQRVLKPKELQSQLERVRGEFEDEAGDSETTGAVDSPDPSNSPDAEE